MATCLGISTENNLIKYAKINADHENLSVESFGIKFYDDLEETLKEILDETNSHNLPICMNLTDEMYNEFSVFRMLKKKDVTSVLNSEFELLCEEKGYNFNALDSKYILAEDFANKEKARVIYISAEKSDLTAKMQKIQKFRVGHLVPLPVAVTNLADREKENFAIVNIEEKTTVTTVVNNDIYSVDVLETGMKEIFERINEKENSLQKAYEICKNTVIYTMETSETQLVENVYLKDIMPTLFKIVSTIKQKFEAQLLSVRKIYITGSAALINNIDLYFQEYMPSYKCEILSPYFIDKFSDKANVKDYIEVNSAIAVAMQGIEEKYKDANFKNNYVKSKLLGPDINLGIFNKISERFSNVNTYNPAVAFRSPMTSGEKVLVRISSIGVLAMVVFGAGSVYLNEEMNKKIDEVNGVINDTNKEIALIKTNTERVRQKSLDYTNRISKLENLTNQVVENNKYQKAIPILLNRIMSVIPKEVKITSIQNTTEGKIVINAEAQNYEDLGFFKATLKTKEILKNVSSDSSAKFDNIVKVTIEGELP